MALAAYTATQSVAVWRWNRLLRAQHVEVESKRLTESMWVSMFFNNFLPSNIGGDVVRIADTAPAAGSKTLATTVILVDRDHRQLWRARRVTAWRTHPRRAMVVARDGDWRGGCDFRNRDAAIGRSHAEAGARVEPAVAG